MFCPNCGKDCGDARFCSECGTKLQQNAAPVKEESGWKAGMPCPYCGATQLDGDSCAYCGARLIFNTSVDELEEDSFELPVLYLGYGDEAIFGKDSMIVNSSFLGIKSSQKAVYSEIKSVTYIRHNQKKFGLTVDTNSGKKIKIICGWMDEVVYQIFCFLRTIAPTTAKFTLCDDYLQCVVPDQLLRRFDTDGFFNTFNPYRKRMIKKIEELTGTPTAYAEAVTARILYIRQEALYQENPSLAIRDLNRAIRERQREVAIEKQEQKQREMFENIR